MKTTTEQKAGQPEKRVVRAQLAGSWYDARPAVLQQEPKSYMDQVESEKLDDVIALILPHAGYRFSGPVAAYGARQIAGRGYRRVVVLGSSHRIRLPNQVALPEGTHMATPLGEVPFDMEFLAALARHPEFRVLGAALPGENSIEMQIPLLQQALGEFRLAPLVVGQLDIEATRDIADRIRPLLDEDTLVVASSDFTHYGAQYGYIPFRDNIASNLARLDLGAVRWIERKDLDGFVGYCDQSGITMCGHHPIGILLALLPEKARAHLLKYDTSGRITGEEEMSVSYVSMAFTGKWEAKASEGEKKQKEKPSKATVDPSDQKALLQLARRTLESYYECGRSPKKAEDLGIEPTPGMSQIMGAFVTLKLKGDLRGCIGEIAPRRPLYAAVMARAIDAAINDSRFLPLSRKELPEVEIEISALTPPRRVASADEIVVGRHGIVLEKDGRGAVFLPQVAPEQGWDLPTTLSHLARKAGLPPDAWKQGATFEVFEAIVFSEHEKK